MASGEIFSQRITIEDNYLRTKGFDKLMEITSEKKARLEKKNGAIKHVFDLGRYTGDLFWLIQTDPKTIYEIKAECLPFDDQKNCFSRVD